MALDEFQCRIGADIFGARGDGSPLGAFLEAAIQYGWNVIPAVDVRGAPGPSPAPEVMEFFYRELENAAAGVKADPVDAVFLVLHGAMALPGSPDVEGDILRRVSSLEGLRDKPIFGVLDLHGNITPAMAEHSSALIAYRENPHTDAAETAVRAAGCLNHCLKNTMVPKTFFVPTDLVWAPPGTATAQAPMRTLEAIARGEEKDGILAVNVFAGFAHADTPHTGVCFTIVYDPAHVSLARLEAVGDRLRESAKREDSLARPHEWDLEEALDDALAQGKFPALLVEPADNIGGGAPGDGTAILRALLKRNVHGGGVVIRDPESIDQLRDKVAGDRVDLRIGGKTFALDPGPVEVRARLIRKTDGRFQLEDIHSHMASMSGISVDMGPSAVLEVDGVTILLTTHRIAPMDLGQWRSQGVEPAELRIIGVKAAVAHRQAYDPITRSSYWVRTPGPCTSDLTALPYKLIRESARKAVERN